MSRQGVRGIANRLIDDGRRRIALVTPVLDDWACFAALLDEISALYTGSGLVLHVFAVDDGSHAPFDPDALPLPLHSCIVEVEIIRLALNLGHQRAIAVGLCAVAARDNIDAVLVMDSDGEDRPADIAPLLSAGWSQPDHVILAHRAQRSESFSFRVLYVLYKLIFHMLTGQTISFGNYALLPMVASRRLVHMPELWNNLAASIIRSRIPYATVPTIRGRRYRGGSRMNLVALVVHGLSAMSVHTDTIFVRMLLAATMIAGLSSAAIVVVAIIRFATALAIPGWATNIVGDLLIILLQTVVIVVAASLTMLAGRSNRPIIPIVDAPQFVAGREVCRIASAPAVAVPPPAA